MIKLKDILLEALSDEEIDDIAQQKAELYFSIGQDDEEMMSDNFCWIWNGSGLIVKKGGTHGINFSHEVADRNFKGWYDVDKNAISVVFPNHELRKLKTNNPTVDDIPTRVYDALKRQFGSPRLPSPIFYVFESILKETDYLDDRREYDGWLSSSLEFISIVGSSHEKYAIEYLKSVGVVPDPSFGIYEQMYQRGFVRMVLIDRDSPNLYFEYSKTKAPSDKQMRYLKNLAIENRYGLIDSTRNVTLFEKDEVIL